MAHTTDCAENRACFTGFCGEPRKATSKYLNELEWDLGSLRNSSENCKKVIDRTCKAAQAHPAKPSRCPSLETLSMSEIHLNRIAAMRFHAISE